MDVPGDAADLSTSAGQADLGDRLRRQLAVAHNNLGVVLRGTGRRAEAEAAFAEAVRIDPTRVDLETYLRVRRSSWLKSLRTRRRSQSLNTRD